MAIIGAGVSGLVAGFLLKDVHEVHVFDANDYAGGHTHTVRVDAANGGYDIDTGFIVFNDRNYPLFTRLLDELGVASQPTTMSFSVADRDGTFEFSSASANGVFAVRRHMWDTTFHRALLDVLRCQRAVRSLASNGTGDLTLGEWLAGERFSDVFVDRILVPMVASIWSGEPKQMWDMPMAFIANFFGNHGMLQLRDRPSWSTIVGGSSRYVDRLVDGLRGRVRLSTPVERIERCDAGVVVAFAGGHDAFDHVIVATHTDQALRLLGDATDRERNALAGVPYQENDVVLHTDRSLLPRRRRAWASWNYHLMDPPPPRVVMTYDMTNLQRLPAAERYCLTLNRTDDIDPSKVLGRFSYSHPVFGPATLEAQAQVRAVSGTDRVHLCGAYQGWGFHEDGVASAVRVARDLGGRGL